MMTGEDSMAVKMYFAPELFTCYHRFALASLRSANRWICGSLPLVKFALTGFAYPLERCDRQKPQISPRKNFS